MHAGSSLKLQIQNSATRTFSHVRHYCLASSPRPIYPLYEPKGIIITVNFYHRNPIDVHSHVHSHACMPTYINVGTVQYTHLYNYVTIIMYSNLRGGIAPRNVGPETTPTNYLGYAHYLT